MGLLLASYYPIAIIYVIIPQAFLQLNPKEIFMKKNQTEPTIAEIKAIVVEFCPFTAVVELYNSWFFLSRQFAITKAATELLEKKRLF